MRIYFCRTSFIVVLLTVLSTSAALTQNPTTEPMRMRFMAGYRPQANLPFVGVYVAQDQGFFTEEGLEVTIEHAAGNGSHLQLVTTGEVQVTTQDAGVLLRRRADPGLPLVSLALIGQRGQQAFAALSDSGIKTPADWVGHTIGYKGTPSPDLFALLNAFDVSVDDVELVDIGFDPRILTEGLVDIYPLFRSNEPYLIQEWGYDITVWDAADHNIPTLGLTYVTSEATLQAQPEMLKRFLRAALRGIEYAAENPDEAVEMVLHYAGPETDPDHMRFMLESELADAYSDTTDKFGLGWQTLEQWQGLADMLAKYDVVVPDNVSKAFTTDILADVYKNRSEY